MEIVNVVVNYGISPNIGSLLEVMCLTFVPDKPTSRCQTLHFMLVMGNYAALFSKDRCVMAKFSWSWVIIL